MMASMSVPGALPPYEVDGYLLVDGGVTNNMPVELAKQMVLTSSLRWTSAVITKLVTTSIASLLSVSNCLTTW